jgi:hypothetical protein
MSGLFKLYRAGQLRSVGYCANLARGLVLLHIEEAKGMFRSAAVMLGALVSLTLLTGPMFAHHSNANYDTKNVVVQKGVVADYDWGNPHVVVVWDVKDGNGNAVRWRGDLASVESEMAAGLTKNSLKPGDEVILTVNIAKDGSPHALVVQMRRKDGSTLCAMCRDNPHSAYLRQQAAQNQNSQK